MVHWHSLNAEEYPPSKPEPIWVTDGVTVFKATWHWKGQDEDGLKEPLKDGIWRDEHGNSRRVITWAFLEDSPDGPPEVPTPHRPL